MSIARLNTKEAVKQHLAHDLYAAFCTSRQVNCRYLYKTLGKFHSEQGTKYLFLSLLYRELKNVGVFTLLNGVCEL
jgi:hypothetical protein